MRLEVALFGGLKCNNREQSCFGRDEFQIDVPDGISVRELIDILELGMIPLVAVVNAVIVKKDFRLSDNDRVAIFPPIAGG